MEDGPSTLVVDDGERLHRLAPLPVPAGNNGLLRLAYTAPLAVLEGHTEFALELPDGSVLGLPAPIKRLARHELEQSLEADRDHRAGAEERVAERDAALEEARERLLMANRALGEERARASAELEQALAGAVQAEQRALEHERARTEAEEQSRASQAEMQQHADRQLLDEARIAAGIEGREAAEARTEEIQQAHLILEQRVEELHRVQAENEHRATALTAELEAAQTTAAMLTEDVRLESQRREELEGELASVREKHEGELASVREQLESARATVEPVAHSQAAAPAGLVTLTKRSAPPKPKRDSRRPEWKAGVTPMRLLRARRMPPASMLYVILLLILLAEVVLTLNAK